MGAMHIHDKREVDRAQGTGCVLRSPLAHLPTCFLLSPSLLASQIFTSILGCHAEQQVFSAFSAQTQSGSSKYKPLGQQLCGTVTVFSRLAKRQPSSLTILISSLLAGQ